MGQGRSRSSSARAEAHAASAVASASRVNAASVGSMEAEVHRLADLLVLRQELEARQAEIRRRRTPALPERPGQLSVSGSSSSGGGSDNDVRRILRRMLQHQIILEYLQRTGNESSSSSSSGDSDSDGEAVGTAEAAAPSSPSGYLDGVRELFVESAEERVYDESKVRERGDDIRLFKDRVLGLFEAERSSLASRMQQAMSAEATLQQLLVEQAEADARGDAQRTDFVEKIIADLLDSGECAQEQAKVDVFRRDLASLERVVSALEYLTSVPEEDSVRCTVCLVCPKSVIWDCVKCDNLVCNACRRRLTDCPTCRISFGKTSQQPRRNRWAERLARMQREKQDDE